MNFYRCVVDKMFFYQVITSFFLFGYLTGCVAFELEPISYEEADAENIRLAKVLDYSCGLYLADEKYAPIKNSQPIAVEKYEFLFVKINGAVVGIPRVQSEDFVDDFSSEDIRAKIEVVRQFNFSEYNESDDRYVELRFELNGVLKEYKLFGARCGI